MRGPSGTTYFDIWSPRIITIWRVALPESSRVGSYLYEKGQGFRAVMLCVASPLPPHGGRELTQRQQQARRRHFTPNVGSSDGGIRPVGNPGHISGFRCAGRLGRLPDRATRHLVAHGHTCLVRGIRPDAGHGFPSRLISDHLGQVAARRHAGAIRVHPRGLLNSAASMDGALGHLAGRACHSHYWQGRGNDNGRAINRGQLRAVSCCDARQLLSKARSVPASTDF